MFSDNTVHRAISLINSSTTVEQEPAYTVISTGHDEGSMINPLTEGENSKKRYIFSESTARFSSSVVSDICSKCPSEPTVSKQGT